MSLVLLARGQPKANADEMLRLNKRGRPFRLHPRTTTSIGDRGARVKTEGASGFFNSEEESTGSTRESGNLVGAVASGQQRGVHAERFPHQMSTIDAGLV